MHNTSFLFGVKQMKISTRYADGKLAIFLNGELDHHSARQAMETIAEAIDGSLPRQVLLDMSGLSFMDSSGIAVILKADRRLKETGGKLFIDCPQSQPLKVLEAAGIVRVVEVISKREVTT